MAEIVLTLGVPHTPLLWTALRAPVPDDLLAVAARFRSFREKVIAAKPDAIVIIGSDHLRQFMTSNMPAFLIGKADTMRGTHPSEQRSFGLPASELRGHCGLASALLGRTQLPIGVDFSFSDEPWLDHAFMVPLLYLTPALEIPVVPVHTNTNAPPIPHASRFVALGRYLREAIHRSDDADRVAVIGSGHLAFELGGPRQFLGRSPDPEFDRIAVELIAAGDGEGLVRFCAYDRLLAAGNLSFQFLNFLTCTAVAGERPAVEAGAVTCRFGSEPFFAWPGDWS
ncbi:MAG TPA: extradiol ring-cleavage dioxygenase [Acidimicrobiia bacterium]|nr:extradiol ring-cleavage dioxygenase [Acidimicrobiia bacterium]